MATKMNMASLALLAAMVIPVEGVPAEWRRVERGGMELRYRFLKYELECVMRAPTRGWLAIGFNPGEGLAGTNLIMGAVRGGRLEVSDRFIRSPGDHRALSELGGRSRVTAISHRQNERFTEIRFRLPREPQSDDVHHHALAPGRRFEILMAFSQSDDFNHHSIMRTAVRRAL